MPSELFTLSTALLVKRSIIGGALVLAPIFHRDGRMAGKRMEIAFPKFQDRLFLAMTAQAIRS
jgi:hypothetical protein